jgi:hypothetical protein
MEQYIQEDFKTRGTDEGTLEFGIETPSLLIKSRRCGFTVFLAS